MILVYYSLSSHKFICDYSPPRCGAWKKEDTIDKFNRILISRISKYNLDEYVAHCIKINSKKPFRQRFSHFLEELAQIVYNKPSNPKNCDNRSKKWYKWHHK